MSAGVAYRAVGLAAALVAVGLLVEQLVAVLLALMLTIIISLPLASAADMAERRGLPRLLGAFSGMLIGLGVAGGLGYLVVPSFIDQAKLFANRLPTVVDAAERYLHGLTGVAKHTLSSDLSHWVQGYTNHPQRLIAPIESVGLGLVGVIAGAIVMLITALYMATNPEPLVGAALRVLPVDKRIHARGVIRRVRVSWIGWLKAMVLDMIVLGGLLYLGLRLVGLGFALGFAVFSALLTVIPNYGSIISAVPPVLFGLAQSPGTALLVLLVYVIVNQIEGNLILPLVMARTVDMHPALVAIGVLVMAQLFGLIGVIIAIPLLSLAIILVEELWIAPQEAAAGLILESDSGF